MADEPMFTLDGAAREIARRECALNGHDYNVVTTMELGPVSLACERCGASWKVEQDAD